MSEKPRPFAEATLLTAVPADLLVVGGGLAGIAAALCAARRGASVVLTEEHTTLGRELFPTLRPWLDPSDLERLSLLFGGLEDAALIVGREAALVPDAFKIALEDRLLEAGVRLLYGLRPVERRGRGPFEVSFASKQGLLTVRTRRLVDATPNADLAAWRLPSFPRPNASAWRTVEFMGVDADGVTPGPMAVPRDLAADARLHVGSARGGHVLVEHVVEPPTGATSPNDAELHARDRSFALARWLCEHHPAFSGARVTGTSLELTRPPTTRLRFSAAKFGEREWSDAALRHPDGFWVAGTSADVPDEEAAALAASLARLAELGWSVGMRACHASAPNDRDGRAHGPPVREAGVDVLVIGGGTSGVAAAIGAARQGARVLLADMNMGLGGTGTLGGVDSY